LFYFDGDIKRYLKELIPLLFIVYKKERRDESIKTIKRRGGMDQ
jgi:hypothetical protein